MVVFTCTYCGESVKKNQVQKHYLFTACRSSTPALTCVDCLKDFIGNEHVAHTSCVTEEERYSAKGFVSKPPSNKGKEKQEKWVNFIQKNLESDSSLDCSVKNLLEQIANEPGVPQKKLKFMNFCENKFRAWRYCHPGVIEKTWSFLEIKRNEFQKLQNNTENGEDRKRKRIDSSNECSEFSENGVTDTSKHNPEDLGKKKKKHDVQDNFAEPVNVVGVGNAQAESKKQKKKNKSSSSNGVHVRDLENCNDVIESENVISDDSKENESEKLLSKKEKKDKRKKEKYEKQLLEIHNEPVLDAVEQENNVEETSQKRKKKKGKRLENGDVKDLEVTTLKTVSKKKHKPEQEIEVVKNGEDSDHGEVSDGKPSKFNWEETVVKLLESKGELPLKRVEKKIVNEYINSGVHVESVEKVIAKFNKKILKMSRVKVKKEIVKLA